MAEEVARVANRCEEAKTSLRLDLCACGLKAMPTAIFFLVKDCAIHSFDISKNKLPRLPNRLVQDFIHLELLNASSNHLTDLPDNFSSLQKLTHLDLSNNNFTGVNITLFSMQNLHTLLLQNNQISDINVELLQSSETLKVVNLLNNPLPEDTKQALSTCQGIKILI